MVKVFAPMMSLDASGTLGDAVTFSKWKGRNYVRERVVPSNPKSGAQVGRRAMFRFLTQLWSVIGTSEKATWQFKADELIASTFNAYLSYNMEMWHNFYAPMEAATGARTGTPSDNALTAAAWEENRVKLTLSGSALGDAWGIILFGYTSTGFTPAVGNAILVENDTTIASHDFYWTPPSVTTWYFNSIAFSDDGAKATAGGEQSAVP